MPIPKPSEIDQKLVQANSPSDIQTLLNTHGVAIIALDDITTLQRNNAVNATKFYQNANAIFKENTIKEPPLLQKLMVNKYKQQKAPDASSGMIHQYFTPIHHLLHSSNTLMNVFDTLTGGTTIYAPNRLRICNRFKFDDNSLHIEGKNIFEVKDDTIKLLPGDIACIAGIAGQRRFVFWDMNGADLKPIYDLWVKNGCKNWTKPDPNWMQQHYGGRRRMVTVDCSKKPYLILWSESTPHEIALSPSLSAFISPVEKFDTKKPVSARYWDGDKSKYYVKRFLVEPLDKKVSFISDSDGSCLEVVSTDYLPVAEIEFVKERNKDQRPKLKINFEEFISVKGLKAQGNRLTVHKVKTINVLASLEPSLETTSTEPNP